MTAKSVLAELKSLGTAQNRKVYARHGFGANVYGVSYANLGKLKKKIKRDHELAQQLWASGNHDARVLATMIADPARATSGLLDQWSRDLSNYGITDAFSGYAAATSQAPAKMRKWTRSNQEWVGCAGWNLVAHSALREDGESDAFYAECLESIESRIHKSKNRVRYAMNSALIAIGMRNAKLEKKALASAKRIGTVEVDHGETGCKTPDAASYIAKAKQRGAAQKKTVRKKTAAKKSVRKRR